MLLKLAAAAAVFAAIWIMLFRRPGGTRGRLPGPPAQEMVKCSACGIWQPPGKPCTCTGSG